MSTKKKGMSTVSGEWARHLRPWGRRQFWSAERMAVQKTIKVETQDELWISINAVVGNAKNNRV